MADDLWEVFRYLLNKRRVWPTQKICIDVMNCANNEWPSENFKINSHIIRLIIVFGKFFRINKPPTPVATRPHQYTPQYFFPLRYSALAIRPLWLYLPWVTNIYYASCEGCVGLQATGITGTRHGRKQSIFIFSEMAMACFRNPDKLRKFEYFWRIYSEGGVYRISMGNDTVNSDRAPIIL